MDNDTPAGLELYGNIGSLKPHDHLCFIYDSLQEWKIFVVNFIKASLEGGEKCFYVFDTHTAREVRDTLKASGVNVASYEASGQLVISHGSKIYLHKGSFDPENLINLMAVRVEKALAEGYPAIRITCETDWMHQHVADLEKALDWERRMDCELLPSYPCLVVCQYNRNQFNLEFIKELLLVHSKLIRDNNTYRNFYYLPPGETTSRKDIQTEVQGWLANIEREDSEQRMLRDNLHLMLTVFDKINTIVLVVDETGHYAEANQAALDFFECRREDLLGKSVWDTVPPEIIARQREQNLSLFDTQSLEGECRINGQKKILRINIVPTTVGQKRYALGIGQDITLRRGMEEKLWLADEKYRLIVETAEEGIWISDPRGTIIFVNQKMADMLGRTREQILGRNRFEFIEIGYDNLAANAGHNSQEGSSIQREYRVNRKDGEAILTYVNASPLFDNSGKYLGNLWMHTDITERKKTEKALLQSEERYRSLVDTAGAGVCTIDLLGNLTFVNNAVCRMLGYSRSEIIGKHFSHFLHPEDKEEHLNEFNKAALLRHQEQGYFIEFRILCKDGQCLWFSSCPLPLFVNNIIAGYNAIIFNITEFKKVERELKELQEKWRELSSYLPEKCVDSKST